MLSATKSSAEQSEEKSALPEYSKEENNVMMYDAYWYKLYYCRGRESQIREEAICSLSGRLFSLTGTVSCGPQKTL